jgi:hypothetical protein
MQTCNLCLPTTAPCLCVQVVCLCVQVVLLLKSHTTTHQLFTHSLRKRVTVSTKAVAQCRSAVISSYLPIVVAAAAAATAAVAVVAAAMLVQARCMHPHSSRSCQGMTATVAHQCHCAVVTAIRVDACCKRAQCLSTPALSQLQCCRGAHPLQDTASACKSVTCKHESKLPQPTPTHLFT